MKYRVYFKQTETFYVDVEAEDGQEASDKGCEEFNNGGYKEVGDCEANIENVIELDEEGEEK